MKVGLFLNAALLGAVLLALLNRGGQSWMPTASAQPAPMPIAGGGGFYLMPAQFTPSQWGCYIMDTDAQTLAMYFYDTGKKELRLVAGRSFAFDRQLKRWNTSPDPSEIQNIVKAEQDRARLQAPPEPDAAPGAAVAP